MSISRLIKTAIVLLCSTLSVCAQLGTQTGGSVAWHGLNRSGAAPTIVTNFNDLLLNHLVSFTSASSATSYTTGSSYQPAPNSLVMAFVSTTTAVGTQATNPSTLGAANGLTWALVTNCWFGTAGSNNISVWIAQGASPTSTTLTATFWQTETSCCIDIYEYQNADKSISGGAGAIVASYTNGTTAASANPSISFTTPAAAGTNALIWVIADNVNSTTDEIANTNWGRFEKIAHGTRLQGLATHFQLTALPATAASSIASSRAWGGVMLEVKPSLENDPTTRPTMVQWKSTYYDSTGQVYTVSLPNATLSGNALTLLASCTTNTSYTVKDDQNNNWAQITTVTDLAPNLICTMFIATNIAANTHQLWLTTSVPIRQFVSTVRFEVGEWAHVALYNPVDISLTNCFFVSSDEIANTGRMVPTTDGDLILNWVQDVHAGTLNSAVGTWTNMPHQSLGRFITTVSGVSSCVQYGIQSKAGGIDSFVNLNQGSQLDAYSCLAVALKRGPGGTMPPTNATYIYREMHETVATTGISNNFYLNYDGNLLVLASSIGPNNGEALTNVTDYVGRSYWKVPAVTGWCTTYYASNYSAVTRPPVKVIVRTDHTAYNAPYCVYDVVNASPFPYDTFAEAGGTQSGNNAPFADAPDITPTTANGLVIDVVEMGQGPPATQTQAGATADFTFFYPGQDDSSTFDAGDGYSHIFNATTAQIKFGFTSTNSATSGWGTLATAFKGFGH